MANRIKQLVKDRGEATVWRMVVNAALRAAEGQGYTLTKQPGRGLSNIYKMEKGGVSQLVAVRTTRDRWVAFPPLEGGARWKTLDDVQQVLIAAVDNREDPQGVDVHLIPADEVRKRFDLSYKMRIANGHTMMDNYGMWVKLDAGNPSIVSESGSGLAVDFKPLAHYTLDELIAGIPAVSAAIPVEEMEPMERDDDGPADDIAGTSEPSNVGEVMAWARDHIARLTGMKPEAIKLDLKIEY